MVQPHFSRDVQKMVPSRKLWSVSTWCSPGQVWEALGGAWWPRCAVLRSEMKAVLPCSFPKWDMFLPLEGPHLPLSCLREASEICPSEWTFAVIDPALQNSNLISTGPLLVPPIAAVGIIRSARSCRWQDEEACEQELGAESVVVTMVTSRSLQATQLVGTQKLLEGPGKSQWLG